MEQSPERATGIAIAALAQVVQNVILMEQLDREDISQMAKQHFNIVEPEQEQPDRPDRPQ
jgi:uncharacterized membrane protein